jgi:SAM-dependent methyltransferase
MDKVDTKNPDNIRQAVRERYGQIGAAGRIDVPAPAAASCCGSGGLVSMESLTAKPQGEAQPAAASCCSPAQVPVEAIAAAIGYSKEELESLPEGANMALGCGNPNAIAKLKPGEVVLDLGSGGGIDCFLAAKKVGPEGRVIGVDMTPEMIHRARDNARKVEAVNVEFRLGEIEHLPVADAAVDVIMSNCVINLSPDKPAVYQEAFRALKPGGRLAISDVVASRPLPEAIRQDPKMLCSCIGGAETIANIETMLAHTGFTQVRVIANEESRTFIKHWVPESGLETYIVSAVIEAVKP